MALSRWRRSRRTGRCCQAASTKTPLRQPNVHSYYTTEGRHLLRPVTPASTRQPTRDARRSVLAMPDAEFDALLARISRRNNRRKETTMKTRTRGQLTPIEEYRARTHRRDDRIVPAPCLAGQMLSGPVKDRNSKWAQHLIDAPTPRAVPPGGPLFFQPVGGAGVWAWVNL
jgi:hypothetical protein